MKKILYLVPVAAMIVGCSPKSNVANVSSGASVQTNQSAPSGSPTQGGTQAESHQEEIPQAVELPADVADSRPNYVRLKATVFKMNGDYANNVAVTVGPNGNLTYFPAPSDLTAESAPVEIGEGWWLNRQGISANSVFTKYTFDEYRNLKSTPSPAEIKAMIIPGSEVTDFRQLVLPASEARNLPPQELLKYIKD